MTLTLFLRIEWRFPVEQKSESGTFSYPVSYVGNIIKTKKIWKAIKISHQICPLEAASPP